MKGKGFFFNIIWNIRKEDNSINKGKHQIDHLSLYMTVRSKIKFLFL